MLFMAGVPEFIAKSVKKPSFTVSETPHEFLNYKFYYPGRVDWNTVELTLVDPVQPDSTASLMKILEAAGYVVPTDYTAQDGKPKTISKKSFVDALGEVIRIKQIGANTGDQTQNQFIESWSLHNPWITSVDFGNLDYSSDELINISLTIRYDWATLEVPNPGNIWQLNQPR